MSSECDKCGEHALECSCQKHIPGPKDKFFSEGKFFENEDDFWRQIVIFERGQTTVQDFDRMFDVLKKDVWMNLAMRKTEITNSELRDILGETFSFILNRIWQENQMSETSLIGPKRLKEIMGQYCACGIKLSASIHIDMPNNTTTEYEGGKCICDWDGWISTCDWPEDRKNKDTPIRDLPPKSGRYLFRQSTTCGDRYEDEGYFSLTPLKTEEVGYMSPYVKYDFHWEDEEWEVGGPYAWKQIETVTK